MAAIQKQTPSQKTAGVFLVLVGRLFGTKATLAQLLGSENKSISDHQLLGLSESNPWMG